MIKLARLQLVGPVVVFLTVLTAEAAVYALAYSPSSRILWFLNLRLFNLFQQSYYVLSSYVQVNSFQLFFIALPLLLAAVCGYVFRRSLLLAVASNLSFVYASFLVYCSYMYDSASQQASLVAGPAAVVFAVPSTPYVYIIVVLIGASLLSFVVSHVAYLGTFFLRAQSQH
jgi:hypothetical protein